MQSSTTELVYQFIHDYIQEHQNSPSLREIAAGCHLGLTTVFYHLNKLEAEGRIEREAGEHRGLRLPKI